MSKITIEFIREELEKSGWKVITPKYKNLDEIMLFKCPEGHDVIDTWKRLRAKTECPSCRMNKYKNNDNKVIPKKKESVRVLALDQSTRLSGWSVYEDKVLIKYGTYVTSWDDEISRDKDIKNWMINMINIWKPDFVAIEGIQYQQQMGVTTFETLARLQGILMVTLLEMNIPYAVCPTNTWRHHCGVKGRTRVDKKRSMQLLTKEWFDVTVTDDEADAIGIGKYAAEVLNKPVKVEDWE